MLQIPPEILRTTFTLVREQQGLRVLVDLSSVCKAWRDIAQPVLWSHVVLNNNTFPNFIDSHANATDKLKTVRSLTLHIQVITLTLPDVDTLESSTSHGCAESQTLHRNIERFSDLISLKLTSLESLSFFVDAPLVNEEVNAADDGFWLEPAVLGRLLRSLPASCTSLELDTSGTDWSPRPQSHHLCPDIRYILPRLRHIKLRIYTLCSCIIVCNLEDHGERRDEPDLQQIQDTECMVQADHLSTLSICMISRIRAGRGFVTCPELQAKLDRGMNPLHITGGGGHNTKPLLLTSNLVSGHKQGCFPAALKLEVVQRHQYISPDPYDSDDDQGEEHVVTAQTKQRRELYERAILIRDCIEDKTYPLPLRYIADGMTGLYDKCDTCVVGAKDDLERHAENTIWNETIYGARMPFAADTSLAGATPRLPPILLTRKKWRQRSKKGMISWRREEGRPGIKIRRVIPLDGVDVDFDHSMMSLLPARGDPIPGDDRVSESSCELEANFSSF